MSDNRRNFERGWMDVLGRAVDYAEKEALNDFDWGRAGDLGEVIVYLKKTIRFTGYLNS